MIDKYRLDDLRLESGEKGELARWVIQLQKDLDYERRKVSAPTALAAKDAEPVAWDYEWASCITCEGPQGFKRVIEREAPPQWAINEGQARNIVPLYTAAPSLTVPVVPDEAINRAVDGIMATYAGSADECRKLVRKHIEDACRAAMLNQEKSNG